MPTVPTVKPETPPSFPASDIESCIREFLAKEAIDQASLNGDSDGKIGNVFGPEPSLDSLVMVEALIELEEHVPFELPIELIRPGGYESVDEMIDDLLPQLKDLWDSHHGEKGE